MREEEKVVLILEIGFQAVHQRKNKENEQPSELGQELGQMGKNKVYIYIYIYIYGEFFDILVVVQW